MGCICTKAVVVPVNSTPVVNQSIGDSSKPWKKNQVVPAPMPRLGEGAGQPGQPPQPLKTPLAAFSVNGQDTQPSGDQGPADVLGNLKALCSVKVDGTGLARLAEQLYGLIKQHLTTALRSVFYPKDMTRMLELIKSANVCCSSILQPVFTHINRVLSNRQASSTWSECRSWEQVEFSDFLGILEDACTATYDLGVMEVGRPVAALMEIIHELCQHCEANNVKVEESVTQVPALDELMAMLGIIYFRKVVLETTESAQSKLDQYQQLQEQLGWSDAQLATCTGPEARSMLLYLQQVTEAGEKRANVTARRSAAFWDAFDCAKRESQLPLQPGGPTIKAVCHKYFPLFIDEFAPDQGGNPGAAGRSPAVEAGEGHGPRKEFFKLVGQDMSGQQPQQTAIPMEGDAGADGLQSQQPRQPSLWVFNRTAGFFWYNTTLTHSVELKAAYTFAGWLLGQSLLNRTPLGLPLPAVLFQGILDGPAPGDASNTGATDAGGAGNSGGGFQPTLEMLQEFDPDAAAGIRNVAALPPSQLRDMLELEGLPTDWSAQRYTQHAAAQVLRDDVAWQSAALAAGFFAAVDRRLLRSWRLGPRALAALVIGGDLGGSADARTADLSSLFRVSLDDELSGPSALLVELLWQVLGGWPAERRLRFVEFVTGTSRLPLPGSELLKIQAPFVAMGSAEHKATLGMLPQAHTCDNLLELPNYWESLLAVRGVRGGPAAVARGTAELSEQQLEELRAEAKRILDERLELAVMNFQGYGLDERSSTRADGFANLDADSPSRLALGPPEPSLEPDIPQLKPAALTADSLASLARFSGPSSSILHSSHPLAFSGAIASPPIAGQRGGINGLSGNGATTFVQAAVAPGAVIKLPSGSPPMQQLQLSWDTKAAAAAKAEREATLLARFDVDLDGDGRGEFTSGGGFVPHLPPVKRESTSEDSNDVFK